MRKIVLPIYDMEELREDMGSYDPWDDINNEIDFKMALEYLEEDEKEIAELLVEGFSYREIEDEMCLSRMQVRLRVDNVSSKLSKYLK